jgi:hypothetical protein
MSNYLAIATVTATLQRIVQTAVQQDVPGARVTTVKPDAGSSGTPEVGVNVYMYQALPNPAWRNADLRNRRPKGDLSKQAQAGIDLYYLMTFYGNDVEYEPQRLLGSTIRTLIDQPILTQEMIAETVNNCEFLFGSTLVEQVEKVSFTPAQMNTEELSKIWSVFFQCPYVLSFAYQGSTILIEGDKPGKIGLPLRDRTFYVHANQPIIEQVSINTGLNQPATLSNIVTIRGKQLGDSNLKVKIGDAIITPQNEGISEKDEDTQIKVNIATLLAAELNILRAGVQSLQVLHSPPNQNGFNGSNTVPFVLAATVTDVGALGIEYDNSFCMAEIRVCLDLDIGIEQKVFLLLNERTSANPRGYVFPAQSRTEVTNLVTFFVKDIIPDGYLLRVQIDDAETLLECDRTTGEYVSPTIEIQ